MARKFAKKVVATLRRGELPDLGVLNTPELMADAIRELIGDRLTEAFVAVYVNARHKILAYEELSSGGRTFVSVETTGIVRNALLVGAVGVVTAHQHPAGDPSPSREDIELHRKLTAQLSAMDVMLLDNLVLGENTFYSFASGGTMRYRYQPSRAAAAAEDS